MIIRDFLSLIYPSICYACGKSLSKGEKHICTFCRIKLPYTGFHLQPDNPVEKIFWGRLNLAAAASLFYFKKGNRIQKLIHQLKYKGKKELGTTLGQLVGQELKNSEIFFRSNIVLPVPLHPAKRIKRGYNQCDLLAEAVADVLNIDAQTQNLIRRSATKTQTHKSRFNRWKNVEGQFAVRKPEELQNKKVLLIDDVITTGSTLEACARAIKHIPDTSLRIVTVACA